VSASLDHDPRVVAAAISSLPGIGPHRLRLLINHLGALDAWRAVRGEVSAPGHVAAVLRENDLHRVLRRTATVQLLDRVAEALHAGNIRVLFADDAQYPASMRGDFAAPAVLFAIGDLAAFEQRRVGVIGTRAASASGRHFARRLGRELAANGVAVVSGLARGIDAAVHRGVLDAFDDEPQARRPPAAAAPARPIAVVASGLDVVYPREHASLWKHVAERGVIVSESPPGCAPDAFRFPLRNRMLAMASELLVVVESRETGGSMTTVREAMKRDIAVMAVPGSPHIPSCAGTNSLLRDGCAPVTSVDDVLVALGFEHRLLAGLTDTRPEPRDPGRRVLAALGDMPRTIDEVALSTGLAVIDVAVALGQLETQGWVAHSDGWWEALTR